MPKIDIDEDALNEYLESGDKGIFSFTSIINPEEFFSEDQSAEVELMPEGTWNHPMAENGIFSVDRARIDQWIQNFKDKILGPELPLDFYHMPDSKQTPGWITDLYRVGIDTWEGIKNRFKKAAQDSIWERIKDGKSLLFASIKLTATDIWEKIKEGSLKYISASVCKEYQDPASGTVFDVIKGAALTNYPYIKNMIPISVNFEEITWAGNPELNPKRKESDSMDGDLEILVDELELEEVEEIQSEDGIAFFAKGDKYGMPGGKAYGFKPKGAAEPYGFVPKIELPEEIANLPKNKQKIFLAVYNKTFRKYKDPEKAMRIAMKICKAKYGFKFEEEVVDVDHKTFGQKFEEFLGILKPLGLKIAKEDGSANKGDIKAEEIDRLKKQVVELEVFKVNAMTKEDETMLSQFKKITPAAKNVILSLLSLRSEDIEFEDKDHQKHKISVRGLALQLIEELKKTPTINLFEIVSEDVKPEEFEDLDKRVQAYMKDHPDVVYKDALLACSPKKK